MRRTFIDNLVDDEIKAELINALKNYYLIKDIDTTNNIYKLFVYRYIDCKLSCSGIAKELNIALRYYYKLVNKINILAEKVYLEFFKKDI